VRTARPQVLPAREADARSAVPAALAAVAEGGLIYLVAQEVAREVDAASRGPIVSYVAFIALFAGGVALATVLRRFSWMPSALGGLWVWAGLIQVIWFGHPAPGATAATVVISLAIAVRAVALALRDWRDPIGLSILLGSVAALALIALGGGVGGVWHTLLPVVVLLFFVGSLASRAASVRLEDVPAGGAGPPVGIDEEVRQTDTWERSTAVVLVSVTALLLALTLTGGRGGLLQLGIGALFALLAVTLGWLLLALSPVIAPILWLLERLHLNLNNFLFSAGFRLAHRRHPPPGHHGASVIGVLLASAVVAALIVVLVRTIRRQRLVWMRYARREGTPNELALSAGVRDQSLGPGLFRRRRELPEETVRRLYAEALVALEGRGIDRPSSATPAEFVAMVTAIFPDAAAAIDALTHAYEDVRYGSIDVAAETAGRLRRQQPALLDVIRQAPRADQPPEEDQASHG
jgi:hypothetical protein